MISPVIIINLLHLLWFLFGCCVLWKVGWLKPYGSESIRQTIFGKGDIVAMFKDTGYLVLYGDQERSSLVVLLNSLIQGKGL
jgi:hypothetical protein